MRPVGGSNGNAIATVARAAAEAVVAVDVDAEAEAGTTDAVAATVAMAGTAEADTKSQVLGLRFRCWTSALIVPNTSAQRKGRDPTIAAFSL